MGKNKKSGEKGKEIEFIKIKSLKSSTDFTKIEFQIIKMNRNVVRRAVSKREKFFMYKRKAKMNLDNDD